MRSAIAGFPRLATGRLTLRSPTAADAPRIAALGNDFEVARMTTSIPHPLTLEQVEDFLQRMACRDPAEEAVFALETPDDGVIGVLGFHPQDEESAPEIGYWLGRPYWGRGYATEAARAAMAWARDDWGRRFVMSGHFADNPTSGRVLCKAGFLYTGQVEQRHSLARGEDAPTRMMVWLA
ncbi:MAG: GNAT family N-acetyltransferase [Caulobacterales bacterium]